jgi:hypothetical protein
MRPSLRYALALAAVLALVGCNDSKKAGSARTAIAPPAAPATATPAEAELKCPPTPALKCPPAGGKVQKAKASAAARGSHPAARRATHAARRQDAYRYAQRAPAEDVTQGLPQRPYRYSELTRESSASGDRLVRRSDGESFETSEWRDPVTGNRMVRSYSSSTTSSSSVSPPVHSESYSEQVTQETFRGHLVPAAGYDAHGFLTWPGKIPARP